MTFAFIVVAVIAGVMFVLWEAGREKLIESEGTITQLKNRVDELMNDPSRAMHGKQTPLTKELLEDVIRKNGFFPSQKEEEWISFKWQGEQYFVSTHNIPGVQFYKGFSYGSDMDLQLLKQASELAMEETWYGRITFSEEDNAIAFRVFGVERSVEHFSDSFMDYMNMLNNLIDCQRHFYQKLVDEKSALALKEPHVDSSQRENKIVS